MEDTKSSIINIALVGGKYYCREVLESTNLSSSEEDLNARIVAVADPNPKSPGMILARQQGLITVDDYHQLYDPKYNIGLFIVLTPEQGVLEDILKTRPLHIRIQSFHVFEVFWKALSIEERKLRKRNEEVETILNGIQDFIVVLSPELEILEVNDAFLKKMGYAPEEVIGRRCYEVFHNIDHPCNHGTMVCPHNDVIRHKRAVQQIRERQKRDGESRYIEVSTFPVWEKNGKISKFVEISRDITKRKKEEEEITRRLEHMVEERTRQLKESHEKLLHQDRMASLGKLAASMVHEINNPIAGTLNLVMLMKRIIREGPVTKKDLAQFQEFLDLMEAENRRISRTVSDLLSFARQDKLEPKRVNLNALIEKILFLNANLLKISGVRVETRLQTDLPDLFGSEDQLQQAFMNFISNAAEAVEAAGGGSLKIETTQSPDTGDITVFFADTGVGIPRENITRLFEPFFTTKKKGKGVGLGLSVAYGIIEEHGGSIQVQSEVNKGTTFKVLLPMNGLGHDA